VACRAERGSCRSLLVLMLRCSGCIAVVIRWVIDEVSYCAGQASGGDDVVLSGTFGRRVEVHRVGRGASTLYRWMPRLLSASGL